MPKVKSKLLSGGTLQKGGIKLAEVSDITESALKLVEGKRNYPSIGPRKRGKKFTTRL